MYASISFPISSFKIFIYKIPESLIDSIQLGSCVNAPINKKLQTGFVVELNTKTIYKGKVLEIDSIQESDLQLPIELWKTIEWIAKYYIVPFGQVLKAAIPNSFIKTYNPQSIQFVKITKEGIKNISIIKNKPAQKKILNFLFKTKDFIQIKKLNKLVSSPHSTCNKLESQGLIKIKIMPKTTDPFGIMNFKKKKDVELTIEQQKIINVIDTKTNKFNPYLLHGVTGSGKTEVYLKLAQKIVKSGKSVLVLVPEISLTPQIADKFKIAFGDIVALWHSKMTKVEKGWTWQQLKKGKYSVVVGARSAIFTPLNNLGLIIVDEEQESTYKQENPVPRYNARDVAMVRGKHAKAVVLLTSATPSLESYYNAIIKKYTLLKLTKRFGESTYPSVKLVDMKKEYNCDNNLVLSNILLNSISDRLKKDEQIIILQNRRGFSNIEQCFSCGEIKMCSQCSVALTYHQNEKNLQCHYCQKKIKSHLPCQICNSDQLEHIGAGTQKVEEILCNKFPSAKILRMDHDTVKNKGSYQKILNQFSENKANILLGTQMIAKGLDFENVTLVGVINADSGLYLPDFRSGEKVFQLIYQVAGRAGRRKTPGLAIIQTYNQDDIYIKTASQLDINKFYNIELANRKELSYPPFSRIVRILILGKNRIMLNKLSKKIGIMLSGNKDFFVLGPTESPIEKIKNQWRFHIIIKTNTDNIINIQQYLYNSLGASIIEKRMQGFRIQIDIDPISMI